MINSIVIWRKLMKKKINNLFKAAVVFGIALAFMIPVSASNTKQISSAPNIVINSESEPRNIAYSSLFTDDFESYEDFTLEFPPWTQFDGDEQDTWGFQTTNFTNEYYIGSYIIFVPSMTDPPLSETPHSGLKYAACFDAVPTDILNDDWMITPVLTSGVFEFYAGIQCVNHDSFYLGIDDFAVNEVEPGVVEISFWAKTGSSQYEKDRFQVGVSVQTNNPSDFVIITPAPYVEPPTSWTQYVYTVDLTGMVLPELGVNITGGLGATATIMNTGDADATNCTATFTISGGLIFVPSGGTKVITVGTISAGGGTGTAKTMIIGFGKPTITVTVTCDENVTASATFTPKFLLLFLLLG
jgi:hypothetical protein